MKPETACIHATRDKSHSTGSVTVPIYPRHNLHSAAPDRGFLFLAWFCYNLSIRGLTQIKEISL